MRFDRLPLFKQLCCIYILHVIYWYLNFLEIMTPCICICILFYSYLHFSYLLSLFSFLVSC